MGKKATIAQVERLHIIHRVLTTRDRVTAKDLQNTLKLKSTKTVHRDIALMRNEYDAKIEWDPREKTYRYVKQTYSLPHMDLYEEDQIFSLMMAAEILREFKYTHLAVYMDALRKHLMESLDEREREYRLIKEKISYIPAPVGRIEPEIWQIVTQALRHNRFLKIVYQKYTGERTERKVAPIHLRGFQGRWYLIAHCYLRGKVLVFNVCRIKEAKFHPDGDFNPKLSRFSVDLEEYFPTSSQMFVSDKMHRCRIQFTPDVAERVMEVEWYERQEIKKQKNGSIILEFEVPSLVEVIHFVMRWGGDAVALDPPELLDMLRDDVQRLADLYL